MTRKRNPTLLLFFLLCFLAAGASGVADSSSPAGELGRLAWMVGSWAGTDGSVEMEEHWIAPKGGVMLGLHRDVFASGSAFFEFLRIEAGDDGVTYWASPRGTAPTPFRLVDSGSNRAVFENLEHDWPQRLVYRLEAEDTLVARAEGDQHGKPRAAEWRWTRVTPTVD